MSKSGVLANSTQRSGAQGFAWTWSILKKILGITTIKARKGVKVNTPMSVWALPWERLQGEKSKKRKARKGVKSPFRSTTSYFATLFNLKCKIYTLFKIYFLLPTEFPSKRNSTKYPLIENACFRPCSVGHSIWADSLGHLPPEITPALSCTKLWKAQLALIKLKPLLTID